MSREYSELERKLNIIARAARDFGLKANIDDLYAKAADMIDDNGIDRYVEDHEFSFNWHHLNWCDGMGFHLDVDGEFDNHTFMRAVNGGTFYVRIKEYEVEWGKDFYLVYDTIGSEGQRVGFLVKTEEV